ncbi:MAG: hypothetical protein WC493_07960 [Zavarzinia sp.]
MTRLDAARPPFKQEIIVEKIVTALSAISLEIYYEFRQITPCGAPPYWISVSPKIFEFENFSFFYMKENFYDESVYVAGLCLDGHILDIGQFCGFCRWSEMKTQNRFVVIYCFDAAT